MISMCPLTLKAIIPSVPWPQRASEQERSSSDSCALKPERGELLNGVSFSLRTYRADATDPGPELPDTLSLNLLMVGAGAIGNGLANLVSHLSARGRIHVVDSQYYGEENLGTCIMIGPHAVGCAKARVMESILARPDLDVQGFVMPFDQYAAQQSDTPTLVINGLDNIPARHDIQRRLWPDVVIDGAIRRLYMSGEPVIPGRTT